MTSRNKVEVINFQIFDLPTEAKLSIARSLFALKDTKGDGYLEPEVASALVQQVFTQSGTSGFKPTPEDVKQFMKQVKSIRQKEITYYEFESYFLSCLARTGHKIKPDHFILRTNRKFNPSVEIQLNVARKQFAKYDNDKNGTLDSKEVYNLIAQTHQLIGMEKDVPSEEEVKYYIELADTDKDGLISIQEYEDLFLLNLKKKGNVVIQYKVVNNAETCEKVEEKVEEEVKEVEKEDQKEKPKLGGQAPQNSNFIVKYVHQNDVEIKLDAARRLFIERDVDKNGRLDQNEVAGLISATFAKSGVEGYNPTPEDVKIFMEAVDTNKDGYVSYEEYERYVIYCLQKAGVDVEVKSNFIKSRRSFNPETEMLLDQARKYFAQFDTDRSGFLEENEIYGLIAFAHKDIGMDAKPTAQEVQKYIQSADQNNDGKISIQEFEDLILNNYRNSGIQVIEYETPQVTIVQETHNQINQSVHSSITVTKVTTVTTRTITQSTHQQVGGQTEITSSIRTTSSHHESTINDSKQIDQPMTETKKFTNQEGGVQEEKEPIRLVESMIRSPEEQSKIAEEQIPTKSFDELNVVVKNDNNQPDLSSSDEENKEKKSNKGSDSEDKKEKKKDRKRSSSSSDEEKKKKKDRKGSHSSSDEEKKKKKDDKSRDSSDEEDEQKVKRNKKIKPQNNEADNECDLGDDEADGKKAEGQKPYVKEAHRQNLSLIGIKYVYVEKIETRLDAARRLFIKHDTNKNGTLDPQEVSNLIAEFFAENDIDGYKPTPEDVKLYIEEVDTNQDGLISYLEYEIYVIKCLEKAGVTCEVQDTIVRSNRRFNPEAEMQLDIARRQFAKFDTDRSGYLEENEIYGLIIESYAEMGIIDYKPTEEDVKYYIQLADTDNDGRISIIEFEDLIILSLKQSGMQVIQYKLPQQSDQDQENVKRAPANANNAGFKRGKPVQQSQEQFQDDEEQKEQEPQSKHVTEAEEQTQERIPAGKPVNQPENMQSSILKTESKVVIIEESKRIVIEPVNQEEEQPKRQGLPSIVIKKVYDHDIEEKLLIARKLFIESDKDQSGELDPMEVATLIQNTFASAGIQGYEPTVGDVKDYIDAVDTDKNGLLSYEEYEHYVITCFEKAGLKCDVKDTILKSSRRFNPQVELKLDVARRLFAKYDTDKSGELEENEVYGIISDTYRSIGINDFKPTVDDVRMWIEMADTDNSGTVSIFEYENLILISLEKAGIEIKRFTTIN